MGRTPPCGRSRHWRNWQPPTTRRTRVGGGRGVIGAIGGRGLPRAEASPRPVKRNCSSNTHLLCSPLRTVWQVEGLEKLATSDGTAADGADEGVLLESLAEEGAVSLGPLDSALALEPLDSVLIRSFSPPPQVEALEKLAPLADGADEGGAQFCWSHWTRYRAKLGGSSDLICTT